MSLPSETSDRDSQEHEPIVGVVIPVHNASKYIATAINSVIEQDYASKFVVIIDDGSTDGSYELIKSLFTETQPDDPNLPGVITGMIGTLGAALLKHSEAKGPAAARNTGIKAVWHTADVYAVLDADDYWLQGKLTKSLSILLADQKNIGLVYSDVILHEIKTDVYTHEFRRPFDRTLLEQENIISNSPIINKVALSEVGLYDETLRTCEDWDLWLRITEKYVAIHIAEPLQVYTITGDNATFTVNNERWQKDWQKAQKKLRQRQ